jgi:hypothetical protein
MTLGSPLELNAINGRAGQSARLRMREQGHQVEGTHFARSPSINYNKLSDSPLSTGLDEIQ